MKDGNHGKLGSGDGAVPAPSVPVEARETNKEEVLTVTLGDQHFNIPKALVANVYSPSPRSRQGLGK